MPAEIVPKAALIIDDDCNIRWECPGCGFESFIWLPPDINKVKAEALKYSRTIDGVKCVECCRKFDTK
jgi:hypothetical protein